MRIPIRTKGRQVKVSTVMSRPAPVKGWNARDPIASMKPDEAIELTNFWPMSADVMLRKGKADHVTGIVGQVESVMSYNTAAGTQTIFAAAVDSFYDVTSPGAVGAAVVSGLTNARWNHQNFTNASAVSYLCCFNGVDAPQYWNGTAWIAITGASVPAITGLTTTDIVSAAMHKRRLWLVQKSTLKAWYLPVDAVGGAAAALDLSGIAKKGGYLMAIGSWSLDTGEGLDDYWVAITSEGELIVYAGTDPTSGTTWAINGVFDVGEPIGRRCMKKTGGDLLLILKSGIYPVSKIILTKGKPVDSTDAISNRIEQAMNTATTEYSANYGWEIQYLSTANMILVNIPVAEGSSQQQYVQNAITGAWARFTGWEANCFEVSGTELYMGGSGVVEKVWSGWSDNDADIIGVARTAFDYFKVSTKKAFKMARPIISCNGLPAVQVGMDIDYEDVNRLGTVTFTAITASLWGIAVWGVSTWSTGLQRLRNWVGVSGVGLCASTRVRVASHGLEVRWQATDILFEPGDGVM